MIMFFVFFVELNDLQGDVPAQNKHSLLSSGKIIKVDLAALFAGSRHDLAREVIPLPPEMQSRSI
jgi:hypothetical protein